MARKPANKKESVKTSETPRYPKRDLSKKKEKSPSTKRDLAKKKEKSPSPQKKILKTVQKKSPAKKISPAKKKSPAKTTKNNKKLVIKKKTGKIHPPYARMISEALHNLAGTYKGIGYRSITYYIDENYPVRDNFSRYVKQALKAGLDSGVFQIAPIAKYRLSPKGRKVLAGVVPLKKPKKTAKQVTIQKNDKKRKRSPTSDSSSSKPKKKKQNSQSSSPSKEEKKNKKKSTVEKKKKEPTKKKSVSPPQHTNFDSLKVEAKYNHIWQYKENNGSWGNYDMKASDQLEEVYVAYLDNREGSDIRHVKSGQWEYEVDFKGMHQTNIQHPSRTVRSIRRVFL